MKALLWSFVILNAMLVALNFALGNYSVMVLNLVAGFLCLFSACEMD